ncbi:MAG: hypothetical protein SGPRY_014260 [Prymnesium sp.]
MAITFGSDATWPKWAYYDGTAWSDFMGSADMSNQTQFAYHGAEDDRQLASAVRKGLLRYETAGSNSSWPIRGSTVTASPGTP